MKKNASNSVKKKLVKLGKSQYVCLCAPYLRLMGVNPGDSVMVSYRSGRIVIHPAR